MIDAVALCGGLARHGFRVFSGVPCSFLDSLINAASLQQHYVAAANEGDAVAIAAGAAIGGSPGVALMQNSGLANAVSPLTSLTWTFRLPVLGFVSLRGEAGIADEPQHALMGRITTQLLDLMEIRWEFLSTEDSAIPAQTQRAANEIASGRSFFFVVRKATFLPGPQASRRSPSGGPLAAVPAPVADELPSRYEVLKALAAWREPPEIIVATTGKTGRELCEIDDAPGNLYLVGSMGCAGSLGLGLSLARPDRRVLVIDGDGAVLMRMGNLATIAHYSRGNLLHLVLDNGAHDSTGGQATVSAGIDFPALAAACGYRRVIRAEGTLAALRALDAWRTDPAPTFLHLRIRAGSKQPLGRPAIAPEQVLRRLREHLR